MTPLGPRLPIDVETSVLEPFPTGDLIDRLVAIRRLEEKQQQIAHPPLHNDAIWERISPFITRVNSFLFEGFFVPSSEEREQDRIPDEATREAIIAELERRGASGGLAAHQHEYLANNLRSAGRLAIVATGTALSGLVAVGTVGPLRWLGIACFALGAYKTSLELYSWGKVTTRYRELGKTMRDQMYMQRGVRSFPH